MSGHLYFWWSQSLTKIFLANKQVGPYVVKVKLQLPIDSFVFHQNIDARSEDQRL